jgi:hypothetical protein
MLALVKEIAKQLGVDLRIEAEAYGEGGLEVYLTLIGKHVHALTLIGGLVTAVCTGGAWVYYQSKLLDQQIKINDFTLDRDKKISEQQLQQNELNLKKTRLEIKKMEQEASGDGPRSPATDANLSLRLDELPTVESVLPSLATNRRIIKFRSQFYQSLLSYSKVSAVGFAPTHWPTADQQRVVPRASFGEFVVRLEELEPTKVEGAEIEIISPVLVRDGGKWRGRFEGHAISFLITDEVFLGQVAQKRVKFQNGTTLVCRMLISLREDEAGEVRPYEYRVESVQSHHTRGVGVKARHLPRTKDIATPEISGKDNLPDDGQLLLPS